MMQATTCSKTEVYPSSASANIAALGRSLTASRSRSTATSMSNGRVVGISSAARWRTAISRSGTARPVPLVCARRPEQLVNRGIVGGHLQARDEPQLGERLGRLDHTAQCLVHAVAQLDGQARIEGQELDV